MIKIASMGALLGSGPRFVCCLLCLVWVSVVSAASIDTGDPVIDSAQQTLQRITSGKATVSDSKLSEALSILFARPAFDGVREENWRYMLFTIVKTRLILEQYTPRYAAPAVRNGLLKVQQSMLQLQHDLATIYGPRFVLDDHIRRYSQSRDAFTQNLPDPTTVPTSSFFDARDKSIHEIRNQLRALGLGD